MLYLPSPNPRSLRQQPLTANGVVKTRNPHYPECTVRKQNNTRLNKRPTLLCLAIDTDKLHKLTLVRPIFIPNS